MFEVFWGIYPRRLAKKDAERAWLKIQPYKHLEVIDALRKHAIMWKQKGTEKEFIPYPASWLNGARWEDEIELAPEMPQCDWNINGNRGHGKPRCSSQAVKQNGVNFFCAEHCAALGLKVVRG